MTSTAPDPSGIATKGPRILGLSVPPYLKAKALQRKGWTLTEIAGGLGCDRGAVERALYWDVAK